jgi:hypothetical protein
LLSENFLKAISLQQCGDVLANLFAFHIFACACGEGGGFKITLLRLHSR